jgi:hypothetical protein
MIVAVPLALLGAFVALLNFYLSFVRYPLHRLFRRKEEFHFHSGAPFVGSLFLWIAALIVYQAGHPKLCGASVALSVLDTGGFHWLLWSMYWEGARKKPRRKR